MGVHMYMGVYICIQIICIHIQTTSKTDILDKDGGCLACSNEFGTVESFCEFYYSILFDCEGGLHFERCLVKAVEVYFSSF